LNIKRSGRTSVSVWGGMWSGGLTRLSRVEGNLTAVQYVNILETNLLAFIRANFQRGERITFIQDKYTAYKLSNKLIYKFYFLFAVHAFIPPFTRELGLN
jgi:hypothetical protein